MSERLTSPEDWIEPELSPTQIALKGLCDSVLAYKSPINPMTNIALDIDIEPQTAYERVRNSSFSELLLPDGASLSAIPTTDYWPDLGLYVADADMEEVWLRAWGWEDDKHRIDPDGPTEAPFDIIRFPGEKDWIHQLDISFIFNNEKTKAIETLAAYSSSARPGAIPSLSRDVYASAYAEMGYEGHNQKFLSPTTEPQALEFLQISQELFDNKKPV